MSNITENTDWEAAKERVLAKWQDAVSRWVSSWGYWIEWNAGKETTKPAPTEAKAWLDAASQVLPTASGTKLSPEAEPHNFSQAAPSDEQCDICGKPYQPTHPREDYTLAPTEITKENCDEENTVLGNDDRASNRLETDLYDAGRVALGAEQERTRPSPDVDSEAEKGMDEREQLRSLAIAAGIREWRSVYAPGSKQLCAAVMNGDHYVYLNTFRKDDAAVGTVEMHKRYAAFIAYANPERILRLTEPAEPPSANIIALAWQLVHAQGRMLDNWNEGNASVRNNLWERLHAAGNALRGAMNHLPTEPAESRQDIREQAIRECAEICEKRERDDKNNKPYDVGFDRALYLTKRDILNLLGTPPSGPQDKWVSVEERLPDEGALVWVYRKNGQIRSTEYRPDVNSDWPWLGDGRSVTHWMHRQSPPAPPRANLKAKP